MYISAKDTEDDLEWLAVIDGVPSESMTVVLLKKVVGVRLESLLPEEVHVLQHLTAAHEDGCEILYHVGIGELCVYPLGTQHFVYQFGEAG